MARKKTTPTDILNHLTKTVLYNQYRNLAVNVFEWAGLPEGITERWIENVLFDKGKILFFKDPSMSYMALPCFQGVQQDVYREPLHWRAEGLGYSKEYHRDDCVLIENNKLRTATHDVVLYFVRKMYEAERTMDTNIRTSKIPWLILCDEKQLLTYKTVLQKVDDNEPAIFGSKDFDVNGLQLFPTRAPFMGNELMDYANAVQNQLLTHLGVDNCPVDKKERLVAGEVESNDQLVRIFSGLMLEARQRACDEINKKWGLSVSVKLRHDPNEGGEGDVAHSDEHGANAGTQATG